MTTTTATPDPQDDHEKQIAELKEQIVRLEKDAEIARLMCG